MADTQDLNVTKWQITKDLLKELGIVEGLRGRYSNLPSQAGQLIDEYATLAYSCQNCGGRSEIDVPIQERYLGNVLNLPCAHCSQPVAILVI